MAVVLKDTTNKQGLVEHLKFKSGQTNLSDQDAVRVLNFSLDDYSYIAVTANRRWKLDSSEDGNNQRAKATLNANEAFIPLEKTFLVVEQIAVTDDNGKYQVLDPIDPRDRKTEVLEVTYETAGRPRYYDLEGQVVRFYPPSDQSRTVRILFNEAIPYFDLNQLGAEIPIPRIHHEYLVDKAITKLGNRVDTKVANRAEAEVMKWEGVGDGSEGGKLRDFFGKRDQDTPRRLKGKVPGAFLRRGARHSSGVPGRV